VDKWGVLSLPVPTARCAHTLRKLRHPHKRPSLLLLRSMSSAFMIDMRAQLAAATAAAAATEAAAAAAMDDSVALSNAGGCGCPSLPGLKVLAQGVLAGITLCGGTPPTLRQLREDPWLLRTPSCALHTAVSPAPYSSLDA
jgi:hypothetical protein